MSWWGRIFGSPAVNQSVGPKGSSPFKRQAGTQTSVHPDRSNSKSWFTNDKGFATIDDGPWRISVSAKEVLGLALWQYFAARIGGKEITISHFLPTEATVKKAAELHRLVYDATGRAPAIGAVELEPSFDNDLFDTVGESHYQQALEQIAGPKSPDGSDLEVIAFLIPDPENPYDPNAVEVVIQDRKVSHLSRDDTEELHAFLEDVGASQAICRARIQYGWKYDRSEGHYCVRLDIDWPPHAA